MSATDDQTEIRATKSEPAAEEAGQNVNNSSAEADVIDARNAAAEVVDAEEDGGDESEEGGAPDGQPILFPRYPAETLSDDEVSMLEALFKQLNPEDDGIMRPQRMAEAMRKFGVDIDEETLRRQLRMEAEDVGGLDINDFVHLMAIFMRRRMSEEDAEQAFSAFDLNHDGYIDEEELAQAMARIGFQMHPLEIDEMIRDADKDGDGKISFEEFKEKMFIHRALGDVDDENLVGRDAKTGDPFKCESDEGVGETSGAVGDEAVKGVDKMDEIVQLFAKMTVAKQGVAEKDVNVAKEGVAEKDVNVAKEGVAEKDVNVAKEGVAEKDEAEKSAAKGDEAVCAAVDTIVNAAVDGDE